MAQEDLKISRINQFTAHKTDTNFHTFLWFLEDIDSIEIDGQTYNDLKNSLFFLPNKYKWTINTNSQEDSKGFILLISDRLLNDPSFTKLLITEVKLFDTRNIPRLNLAPGIAVRVQSILEMIDELHASNLNNKDKGIISLLNMLFIYCEGQCNIKSILQEKNNKSEVVYKFKQLVDARVSNQHEVVSYAEMLHVSPKYLNECVQTVLNTNAKYIITEQLIMRSRNALKFSNKSVKEISFDLGFSSPDYFSSFFKTQTGHSPSSFRKL